MDNAFRAMYLYETHSNSSITQSELLKNGSGKDNFHDWFDSHARLLDTKSQWKATNQRVANMEEYREEERIEIDYSDMIRACREASLAPLITLTGADFYNLEQIQTDPPLNFEIEYEEE